MQKITTQERPGVYSVYEVASLLYGSQRGSTVGLVALCATGTPQTVVRCTSYEEVVEAVGETTAMSKLASLLFQNGAGAVALCPVEGVEDYTLAFDAMTAQEEVDIILCDATDEATQLLLRAAVLLASEERKERIAVVSGPAGATAEQLITRAAALNCERMVLVAPESTEEVNLKNVCV